MQLELKVVQSLIEVQRTLAVAESCTGGLLCDRLTNISGSSAFFKGGVIAYANDTKLGVLRISPPILKQKGAVSSEIAQLMAQNVRRLLKTDYGIGITGIAGPTGGSALKPVGLVFIAIATSKSSYARKFRFKGKRLGIKRLAVEAALQMLLDLL